MSSVLCPRLCRIAIRLTLIPVPEMQGCPCRMSGVDVSSESISVLMVGFLSAVQRYHVFERKCLPRHPVPCGIFTPGIRRKIILCRRATRLGFTCGLKTVRGLGIIAERNAASRALRFAAGL